MSERLRDDELREDADAPGDGGEEHDRDRIARVEYGIVRPDGHAYMDGRDRYTQIVGTTFRSREQAEAALKNVPSIRDREALVVARVAPSEWWEVEP